MNTPTLFAYLPPLMAEAICKLAEEAGKPPSQAARTAKPLLVGALGLGAGTLAGMGAAHLADKAYQRVSGSRIPIPHLMAALPVLGAGLGLAHSLAQAHQMEEMRNALENSDHKPAGGVSD